MEKTSTHKMYTMEQSRHQPWLLAGLEQSWYSQPDGLEMLSQGFDPINLDQMEAVALLNRTDRKFVTTSGELERILALVSNDYWMLAVNGLRLNHYRTLYFDSADFELYNQHANGRAERYKVRSREYADSHQAFLEVKHKTRKDRTIKSRISTAEPLAQIDHEATNWLQGVFPYDPLGLEPKLWNTFTRLTLVSKGLCERATLDFDLTFYSPEKVFRLDGIAIAEVKMDAACADSPFLAQMRTQRIQPQGFSKYCIGASLLYDQVKRNAFKPKLLWLGKMTGRSFIQ